MKQLTILFLSITLTFLITFYFINDSYYVPPERSSPRVNPAMRQRPNVKNIYNILINLAEAKIHNTWMEKVEIGKDKVNLIVNALTLDDIDKYLTNLDATFEKSDIEIVSISIYDNKNSSTILNKQKKIPYVLYFLQKQKEARARKKNAEQKVANHPKKDFYKIDLKLKIT